ncbi:DUF418 domain-containing protein [Kineosporia babensis]|uniref:DUF418 domain-containing protein n=1 Tax=Kineosporia babensis TaxID=499548 RepID=A0A9X1SS44_9ACTN|nr:DUF418 domain-containing protein [Kineosporia babensis]MCD5310272.1 DUF418 domain-containing protein [Kineosporia babensis]
MSQTAPERTYSGPTPVAERSLAPDLARGVMLLLIALANTHTFLRGGPVPDMALLDRAVNWATTTFVDQRAYPMFALLFGYGVARIVARQSGTRKQTRKLLRRRSLLLIGIGVLHLVLLFGGDVLSMYGALLFLGLWAVHWKDRTLLLVAVLSLAITTAMNAAAAGDLTANQQSLSPDFTTQIADRLPDALGAVMVGWVMVVSPYLVGLWAGRRRVLEFPAEHQRLLTVTAVVGIAAAVLGAQPKALHLVLESTPTSAFAEGMHHVTGVIGGYGYAALIALVALRLSAQQPGRITQALAATGQRSMTCYLAQSPVWFIVFTPYLLDLSGELSLTATAALAIATWLATVLMADRMRAAGYRGPFEALTRRLTYRR